MKSGLFSLIIVSILAMAVTVWADESDPVLEVDSAGLEEGGFDCDGLREKADIFVSLQKAVNHDFSTVTDPALCKVMTEQCEHFFRAAKTLQKEYRKECDQDYEIIEVAECDYAANPCHSAPVSDNRAKASLNRKGHVDSLSSVSGVYDVVTLSQ